MLLQVRSEVLLLRLVVTTSLFVSCYYCCMLLDITNHGLFQPWDLCSDYFITSQVAAMVDAWITVQLL
jgi:hypothetical protein